MRQRRMGGRHGTFQTLWRAEVVNTPILPGVFIGSCQLPHLCQTSLHHQSTLWIIQQEWTDPKSVTKWASWPLPFHLESWTLWPSPFHRVMVDVRFPFCTLYLAWIRACLLDRNSGLSSALSIEQGWNGDPVSRPDTLTHSITHTLWIYLLNLHLLSPSKTRLKVKLVWILHFWKDATDSKVWVLLCYFIFWNLSKRKTSCKWSCDTHPVCCRIMQALIHAACTPWGKHLQPIILPITGPQRASPGRA